MSVQNIHVTKWTAKNTKADGTPLVGKFGPYWLVGIQAVEFEGWANGFVSGEAKPEDWTNKEVPLEIFDEEYNGKMQKKFKVPKQSSKELAEMDSKLEMILNKITGLGIRLEVVIERLSSKDSKYPKGSNVTAFDEPEEINYPDGPGF